jgi:hypothetical protein
VLVWSLVIAAVVWWIDDERRKGKASSARQQRAIQKVQQAEPNSRAYTLPGGQLMVLDVPAPMQEFPYIMELQRCYVWRDERGSSSISCSAPPRINFKE